MENSWIHQIRQSKWFWPVCAGVAICMLCLAAFLFLGRVSVIPEDITQAGISPVTTFTIQAPGQKEDSLRQKITTQPAVAYSLQKEQGGFVMRLLNPLTPGSEFVIRVGGKAFSFSVRNALVVSSHFPADGGQKVSPRSGIEFTFNTDTVSLEDFEKSLIIDPPVVGRVEQGKNRLVFYPTDRMEYDTSYKVRLSQPLATPGGAVLEKETTFSFVTRSSEEEATEYMFQIAGGPTYNAVGGQAPLVPVILQNGLEQKPVSVKVYRCGSAAEYKAQLAQIGSYRGPLTYVDTTAMPEVASFEAVPFRLVQDNQEPTGKGYYNSSATVVEFPEALPDGFYAVEFTAQGKQEETGKEMTLTRHMLLQVSDLSVFHMRWDQNLLLWVNDASTGNPVEGARLEIEGAYPAAATTGKDGVATVNNALLTQGDGDYEKGLFTITAGSKTFVDTSYFYDYDDEQEKLAHKYSCYLFTDRPIYRTSDTMKVWGMVRPRSSDTPKPEKVVLDLQGNIMEVTPAQNGLFTAQIPFNGMRGDDWPRLQLKLGETVLSDLYVQIKDYVKPVYTAQSQADKPVYLLSKGDKPSVTLEVSTFDGTPSADFAVTAESWSGGVVFQKNAQQMRTDAQGVLHVPLAITDSESCNSWYPKSYDYRFSNNEAQAENFYQYGQVYVIHRDVMLRGEVEKGSGGTRVLISTNLVDASQIKVSDDLWKPDSLKGAPVSKEVEALLYKVYYTKEKTGTRYDYINREMVPSYTYQRHDELQEQYTLTTKGGSFMLDGLPKREDEIWYRLELSTTDTTGKPVCYELYLSTPWDYGYLSEDGTHRFVLDKRIDPETQSAAVETTGEGSYFRPYSFFSSRFGDGEDVTFDLYDNDRPLEKFEGRLLYMVVQDDFSHVAVSDKGEVLIPFSEALVPNYVITGAYFDGKYVYALEDKPMYFSPQKRELQVSLATDQQKYRPADKITVTATVTDKTTGKPQPGAEIVLSVVDEAIFALQEQDIDILNSIYRGIYWPYVQKYTSYRQPSYSNAGEKGGGGGGDGQMRIDFKDTAWFQNGVTDKNGLFTAAFQLPDNITSWRLSSLALTDDGKAGSVKENVAATKDFFVTPIVSEQLLAGDTLAVGLRSSGVGVGPAYEASYMVTVKNLKTEAEETKTISGKVRSLQTVRFDGLGTGDYTVTIKGSCKGFSDGVRLSVSVVESGIEVSRMASFDLSKGIDVIPLRYPVSISLYDKDMVTYHQVFANVQQKSSGMRTDARLARVFIAQEYKKEGQKWYLSEESEQDAKEFLEAQMLSLLPYAAPDAELTIKAILAVPELVSHNALPDLRVKGYDGNGPVSARYLAEALLGELDADEAKKLLSQGLASFTDEAYLAAALAVSGDMTSATAWYDRAVRPNLKELTGISGQKVLYLDARSNTSREDCTAGASMVATLLQHGDAEALVSYLAQKDSIYDPYLLEQLLYLTRWQPAKGDGAKVSWQKDGQTVTEELGHYTKYLTLGRQQLEQAAFKVLSGTAYADVYYAAPASAVDDDENKLIGVTKTITPVSGEVLRVGELAQITITPDLNLFDGDIGEGELVIDDYLPTGMRFERYGSTYHEGVSDVTNYWYLSSREGQRLRFGAWTSGEKPKLQTIVYYARCAAAGDYVVESSFITSKNGPVWGASVRDTITIEK